MGNFPKRTFGLASQAGFGLVEVLVASLILVIGIGAAITVFVSSGHAGSTAERHQSGVALAQEELERIRSLPYEEIGLTSSVYPAQGVGGELPNPAERVQGLHYVPLNATDPGGRLPVERLVVSDTQRSFSLAPYEAREIESRSGVETAHIFRFVTWRDETECGLLNLQDLNISLARIGGTVTGLLRNLQVSLGGQGLIGTGESSRGTLLGLGNIEGQVLNRVNQLLAMLDQLLAPATRLLNEVVAPTLAPLEEVLARLTGQLDLCDIDLSSLQRLQTVNAALEAVQEPLQRLTSTELAQAESEIDEASDAAVAAANQQIFCRPRPLHLGCLINGLLGSLTSTLNNLVDGVANLLLGNRGVTERVSATPDEVNDAIKEATAGLGLAEPLEDIRQIAPLLNDILAGLASPTDENGKRVVVAVVLEHGGPAGPRQPIWMSTVVTDPDTGLLMR